MNLVALSGHTRDILYLLRGMGAIQKNNKEAGNEQEKCTKTVWLAPTQSWRKLSVEYLAFCRPWKRSTDSGIAR